MAAAKHTPGPWTMLPLEDGCEYLRIRGTQIGKRYKVCNVHAPEVLESQANARLIAASPLLLKALKGMLEVYGITAGDYEKRGIGSASEVRLSDEARAAVAAAEGDA